MRTVTFDETKYKLVPIDSTVDMQKVGRAMLRACGCENVTGRDAELCWSAMIEAAPDAQTTE